MSTSEARRLLTQGAVRLDGEPLDGRRLDLPAGELSGKVLQVGKRRFLRLTGGAAALELGGPIAGYTPRSLLLRITKRAAS